MYIWVKRGMDIVFSSIILLILSPAIIITALAIKLSEPKSKVLFKQDRPGKNEKIFTIYKFRTMKEITINEEGRTLSDIERVTKIGRFLRKTSIDELPQLFNILKGDMSFIGPRPLLVQYLEYYDEEQHKRHLVRPGMSGWAQVNGRNTIDWEKRFELDVWYVKNMSLKIDLKILLMTLWYVITKKDINQSEQAIMPYFRGKE